MRPSTYCCFCSVASIDWKTASWVMVPSLSVSLLGFVEPRFRPPCLTTFAFSRNCAPSAPARARAAPGPAPGRTRPEPEQRAPPQRRDRWIGTRLRIPPPRAHAAHVSERVEMGRVDCKGCAAPAGPVNIRPPFPVFEREVVLSSEAALPLLFSTVAGRRRDPSPICRRRSSTSRPPPGQATRRPSRSSIARTGAWCTGCCSRACRAPTSTTSRRTSSCRPGAASVRSGNRPPSRDGSRPSPATSRPTTCGSVPRIPSNSPTTSPPPAATGSGREPRSRRSGSCPRPTARRSSSGSSKG